MQELDGGAVLKGPAGLFQAAHRLNELASDEGAEDAITADAADGLDLHAGERLAVGNDGQGFQGSLRKPGTEIQPQEAFDVRSCLRRGRGL